MSKGILFQLEEKETYVRAFYRAKMGEGEKEKKRKRNDDKRKDGKSKKRILRKDTKLSYSFFLRCGKLGRSFGGYARRPMGGKKISGKQ